MAYAMSRTPGGPYVELAVPPSRRILAVTRAPTSYDPQLGGFFDIITAPFKLGAKVVSTAAKGAYQVGKFAVTRVPTFAAGTIATGSPVGGVAAVAARELARMGQPGTAGAYPTEYPPEYGYGDDTIPPYTTPTTGAPRRALATPTTGATAPTTAAGVAVAPTGITADTLLKWAPLAVAGVLLLRKK